MEDGNLSWNIDNEIQLEIDEGLTLIKNKIPASVSVPVWRIKTGIQFNCTELIR
jgi:hypothetical protein